MSEQDFKKLLIDTIQYGDNQDKDKIIELLKITRFNFEKTNIFTRNLWNHYKEYLHLCIIPSRMKELEAYLEYIYELCEKIYPANDDYELWNIDIRSGSIVDNEDVSQEILFENIQKQITEEIKSAKYTIWVAMAWFTNIEIYRELLKKKSQGLNIQIVLDDNEKNRDASFDLEEQFETHWVSISSKYKNIMHNKFCMIDFYMVIHGTFNWTVAANYNKETISIDKNHAIAEQFADEFMKLKRSDK